MNKLINYRQPAIKVKAIKPIPIIGVFLLFVIGCSALFRQFNPVIIEKETILFDTVLVEKVKRDTIIKKVYPIKQMIAALITDKSVLTNKKITPITSIIQDQRVLDFITHNEVLKRAYQIHKITGIKMSVLIAQKGLESDWGTSKLTNITKCLGNIKCTNKECRKYNVKGLKHKQIGHIGKHCVQLYDDNPNDRFVRFSTYQEGWNHYLQLIEKRYSKAGKKSTSGAQIQTIKDLGYATDRKYPAKVISIIKNYNLDKLDQLVEKKIPIGTQTGQYVLLTY